MMDLPPDKSKVLWSYENERKWEIIKDQGKVSAKQPPDFYLEKLLTYLDPKASRSTKRRRIIGDATSTQVLRDLEISLRTNSIEWVREFLSDKNRGLDILVDYLTFRLIMQQQEILSNKTTRYQNKSHSVTASSFDNIDDFNDSDHTFDLINHLRTNDQSNNDNASKINSVVNNALSTSSLINGSIISNNQNQTSLGDTSFSSRYISSFLRKPYHPSSIGQNYGRPNLLSNADQQVASTLNMFPKHHSQKLRLGIVSDDVHVCIMCLRAIMNNKYGFNLVMEHSQAINCLALSLNHQSARTKSLVLELLAAICLVKGGHEIIICAFDNFKLVCQEKQRFEILMHYFKDLEKFNIDFMVSCLQFINIIVHSVDDMNFRIHLQYEFTQLGLDEYLENKLKQNESEDLQVQIQAYLDNILDVTNLVEEAEQKNNALERLQQLMEKLSVSNEIQNNLQTGYNLLECKLVEVGKQRDEVINQNQKLQDEMQSVRRSMDKCQAEAKDKQYLLESKISQLERQQYTTGVPHVEDTASLTQTRHKVNLKLDRNFNDDNSATCIPAAAAPPPPLPSAEIASVENQGRNSEL